MEEEKYKVCGECKQTKRVSSFYKDISKLDNLTWRCTKCTKVYKKKYELANADKIAIRQKEYRNKHKDKRRDYFLSERYGITLQVFKELSKFQGDSCAICGTKEESHSRNSHLSVDHCHSTLEVRGILCHSCNLMLGYAKDDVRTLSKAIKYLTDTPMSLFNKDKENY